MALIAVPVRGASVMATPEAAPRGVAGEGGRLLVLVATGPSSAAHLSVNPANLELLRRPPPTATRTFWLLAGDKSRFAFADSVHPTPYGHKLMAQLMSKELTLAGWL